MVSVIIPVFNRAELAAEAACSVLSQSYEDLELILTDDGSDPEQLSLMEELMPKDSRIRILKLSRSGKPGLVRNRGVAASRGEWAAFLDSDDLWLEGKLGSQMELLQRRSGAVLVHTRERWLRNGQVVSQSSQRHRREGMIFTDALKKCIIGPSTVLLRKSVFMQLGGFREDLEIAEDYEFWLRWCALFPVDYIDTPLVEKREGPWEQLSHKYGHIEKFRIAGLKGLVDRRWFEQYALNSFAEAARRELARKCAIYAQGAAKRGREAEAALYREQAAAAAASLQGGPQLVPL